MYRSTKHTSSEARRGIILLIVLTMLTLFAVIGISFVLLADAEANSSRIWLDSQTLGNLDDPSLVQGADPATLSSDILSELVWGVADDATGVQSAIRGHELSRTMYGYYYLPQSPNGTTYDPRQLSAAGGGQNTNFVSFNGTGRLHVPSPTQISQSNPQFSDDYYLVNYQYFQADNFLRDPERGVRPIPPNTQIPSGTDLRPILTPAPYTGGANAPYTYPDVNNMALAAVMADGRVMSQSFHRPWLWNYFDPNSKTTYGLDPGNPHWYDTIGKYLMLRPRPIDMGPGFPYPEDGGGDVKNLTFSPGFLDPVTGKLCNNDSVWIDPGLPVLQLPSGKKFKPLVAILAMDLDNRPNINVHGNMRGVVQTPAPNAQTLYQHASYQGCGRNEVSLARVLTQGFGSIYPASPPAPNQPPAGTEWLNVFTGSRGVTPPQAGRYGLWTMGPNNTLQLPQPFGPGGQNSLNGTGEYPRFYSQVDADAVQQPYTGGPPSISAGTPTTQTAFLLPAQAALQVPTPSQPAYFPFPFFDPASFGNGDAAELKNHPLLYNYFSPGTDPQNATISFNGRFDVADMESLLRYGCKGVSKNTPTLLLLPQNLMASSNSNPNVAAGSYKRRHLITTTSFGLERPALAPWIYTVAKTDTDPGAYTLPAYTPGQRPPAAPIGAPVAFPQPATNRTPAGPPATRYGDFGQSDWRNIQAVLTKVDLTRLYTAGSLPDYPLPDSTTGLIDTTQTANVNAINAATTARQQLATDLFVRMVFVTTGMYVNPKDPASDKLPLPNTQMYAALRWLAQLSVNIVDYLDPDDIITPFQWDVTPGAPNSGYVFGTELPRLVVNEAYVSVDNDPDDPGLKLAIPRATTNFRANFWVELLNPFKANPKNPGSNPPPPAQPWGTEGTYVDDGVARLQTVKSGSNPVNPTPAFACYQVVLAVNDPTDSTHPAYWLRDPSNVAGTPGPKPGSGGTSTKKAVIQQFVPETTTDPAATPKTPSLPTVDVSVVQPNGMQYAGTNGGNNGFYVLGPRYDFPDTNAATRVQPTLRVVETTSTDPDDNATYPNSMSLKLPVSQSLTQLPNYTILLRRLACPGLPPQNDPTKPLYNPYITVDYLDNVVPNLGIQVDSTGNKTLAPAVASRKSYGRPQPYAGDSSFGLPDSASSLLKSQAPVPANATGPQHTFFQQNADASLSGLGNNLGTPPQGYPAFDWLVHLDRQMLTPVELLHVSAFHPHELTQQFQVNNNGTVAKFQHTVNWFDETNRLYRMFEFLETHDVAAGGVQGGRIPGKINVNTIWDLETFLAVCDPQGANNFTAQQIQQMFNWLTWLRSPGLIGPPPQFLPPPTPQITPNDQPFLGLAPGVSPGTVGNTTDPLYLAPSGIKNTIFRSLDPSQSTGGPGNTPWDTTNPNAHVPASRLFEPGNTQDHPYYRYQLLTKIFNNLTTRSNVFAVWMTIGYFEVTDDTTLPVKLGAELGKSNGTNVRHRMFAVVDRTAMTVDLTQPQPGTSYLGTPGQRPVLLSAKGGVNVPQPPVPTSATLQIDALSGVYEGTSWKIQQGTQLLVGIGSNEELVTVTATAPPSPATNNLPTFTAMFNASHPDPVTITFAQCKMGNPGPQPLTGPIVPHPWDYPVVPYYKQID